MVGTMGYGQNYGYRVLVLSNVCHISALRVPCWPVIVSKGSIPKKKISQIVEKVHNFLDPPPPRIMWTILNLGKK